MKRLSLVILFCTTLSAFAFSQNDCRTQDSLMLLKFECAFDFNSGFEWDIELPMDTWYGVSLSPEGCVEQLHLSGVLTADDDFDNFALPQLTHIDLSNNELRYLPAMTNLPQLLYANVAHNNLDFWDLRKLPNSTAELVYTPQAIIGNPEDVEVIIGEGYTIQPDYSYPNSYYPTGNDVFVWYKDGIIIDTTTTDELELTNVQPSDAGTYTISITDTNFPDLTLETAPVVLSVAGCRVRDSLALVNLYEDVEFKTAAQQWDLSQPMNTWYGVTLSAEGCLERLEISNALKGGYFNNQDMTNWINLTHLDISNNELLTVYGIARIPNLTYLNIQNNDLTFWELLISFPLEIDSVVYAPQLPVAVRADTIIDAIGNAATLSVRESIDQNHVTTFKWYRNNTEIATLIDDAYLNLTDLQMEDTGIYICEMTNPDLPDLTLYSDPIYVSVVSGAHLDSLTLRGFYESVTFQPEHDWDLSQPMNTWEGVILNAEGRVEQLVLPGALTGGEPDNNILRLNDLEYLDLSNNNLTGDFLAYNVSSPAVSSKLSYIDLSDNEFSRAINIAVLGTPEHLKHFDFSNNRIGYIYNFYEAENLEYLDLSNNLLVIIYLPRSEDLKVLKLANNVLRVVYFYSNDYEQLHTVELQNNQMPYLPSKLFKPSVDSLNVSGNLLTFEDLLRMDIPETYIYAPQDTVGIAYSIHQAPGSNHTIYIDFDEGVESNSYAWYKDGNFIATTTEGNLPLSNLQTTDAGDYTCEITNSELPELLLITNPFTVVIDEVYASDCRLRDSLALIQIGSTEASGLYPHWDFSEPLGGWRDIELSEEGCVIELDIDDYSFRYISPAIGQLLDIEYIHFNENALSGPIPHSIGNLTNLRHFIISDDGISGPIPIELTTLPNLETLIIEKSNIIEIPSEIGNLTTLKTLNIGGFFTELPPEMFDLNNLEALTLRGRFTELPLEIFDLTNLKDLTLEADFTELPPEIGQLTNLERLDIKANLTTLPTEINNLTNLRSVRLTENQLSSLPPNLAENWTNLEYITLYNNYLTFDDLLQFQNLSYSSQNTIGTPDTVELTVGEDFMIDLGFDESVTDNTYNWYLNDSLITTTNINELQLTNIQLADVGIYTCQVVNPNFNFMLHTAPITLVVEGDAPKNPVYPGDTNANGIVNLIDVLFWGLTKGSTGEVRPNASIVWAPQPAPDWNNTIIGINGKHQDCNGNGLVDVADLEAIEVNYLKTNADYQQQFYQDNELQISPQIVQAQNFANNSQYEININLGSNAQGAATIHGVSFSIDLSGLSTIENYTAELTNTNSWLAPSNIVSIHDDYTKRSEFALTRSDLQNKTGIGSIGTAIIITENLPTIDTLQLRAVIRNITAAQSDGTLLHGEDVFIGSFSSGSGEGFIPGLAFEAIAYAATCQEPSSATVTVTSGTPPYQYQWNNGDINATAENLMPGEYEVTVTDNFGQTLTGLVTVPDGAPLPDIELQTNTTGQIEVVSNLSDIQHEWNGTPGTALQNLLPGVHTLTISDALTCSKTVSVWVADIYSNVFLEGIYDAASGLMNDNLRQLGLIPLTDPYIGRMSTTEAVLQATGNSAIVDWILLELHDKNTPGKVISSYPALLRRDGSIISNDGINPPRIAVPEETDYYLVVKHRNHLPVKSGATISLSQITVNQNFDQGNASLQKEMNEGIYAAFAGDIATDHTIDGLDKTIWEPLNGTSYQYHPADTNLDGDINGADKGVWFPNNGTFTDIE